MTSRGCTTSSAASRRGGKVKVRARRTDGSVCDFSSTVRIDTPQEVSYYQHGGILHYVLRQLLLGSNHLLFHI